MEVDQEESGASGIAVGRPKLARPDRVDGVP